MWMTKEKDQKQGTLNAIPKTRTTAGLANVWISPHENGHLQATGIDAKGRKQYRYHAHGTKSATNPNSINCLGLQKRCLSSANR
jgi:hypothetical protein